MTAVLLICLSVVAPARWEKRVIGIDAEPEIQKLALHQAKQWQRSAHVKFRRGPGITISYANIGGLMGSVYWEIDECRIIAAHILINPKLVRTRATLQVVLLHELGHALGLLHTRDSQDVMYPVIYGNSRLSDGDKAAMRGLYR